MRILHLPGKAITGYSEDEMKDLLSYFEPDISVTTRLRELQKRRLEKLSMYESIHLDSVSSFAARNLGGETLLLLNDGSSLEKIDLSKLEEKKVTVVTDQIKEDIHPESFEFELLNTHVIDRLQEELAHFHVLSTEIEAGKKPGYEGKEKQNRIYGFGLSDSLGGPKIPNAVTGGKRPHLETLDVQKVGLSAVPGLGDRFTTELENCGISSRKELCSLEPSDILEHDGIGPYRSTKWICSAKAIEEENVFRIRKNDLEDKHRLFIDIETDSLKPEIIWHIGLYDDKKGGYRSFVEKEPDKKGRIIRKFMDYLKKNTRENSVLLAWYGKKFDFEHLDRFIEDYDQERREVWDDVEKIDFMYWVDKHAALPCRSSKLESVADRLGYEPELRGLDGGDVARKYTNYMDDREKMPDWDELMTYAKDDVISMKYIYDKVKDASILHDIKDIEREYRKIC